MANVAFSHLAHFVLPMCSIAKSWLKKGWDFDLFGAKKFLVDRVALQLPELLLQ